MVNASRLRSVGQNDRHIAKYKVLYRRRLNTFFRLIPHLLSTSLTSGLDWTGTGSWSRFALLRTGLDAPIHYTFATIAIAIARPHCQSTAFLFYYLFLSLSCF